MAVGSRLLCSLAVSLGTRPMRTRMHAADSVDAPGLGDYDAPSSGLPPAPAGAERAHRAGFVSIVGSPNVGKSTLMNRLLGEHMSIVTPKASTTRQRIMGIANEPDWQIVYSDTPGVVKPKYKLHQGMMSAVRCAIEDADIILFVTDVLESGFRDEKMLSRVQRASVPVLLIINKVDLLDRPQRGRARKRAPRAPPGAAAAAADDDTGGEEKDGPPPMDLPGIRAWWSRVLPDAEVHEVSARNGSNVELVLERVLHLLPEHPPFYDKAQLSDRPEKFFAAEFVREQIFETYEDEVPYSCEVVVESFKELDNKIVCEAAVHVMRDSQKGIVIGHKGQKIKEVTERAQRSLYRFFGKRFDLRLRVKVSKGWRADDALLREFGYLM